MGHLRSWRVTIVIKSDQDSRKGARSLNQKLRITMRLAERKAA
jgi:hypothetical protein